LAAGQLWVVSGQWSLWSRTGRGVHAASAWPNPVTLRCCLSLRKARTAKRPQGRAPSCSSGWDRNTYWAVGSGWYESGLWPERWGLPVAALLLENFGLVQWLEWAALRWQNRDSHFSAPYVSGEGNWCL